MKVIFVVVMNVMERCDSQNLFQRGSLVCGKGRESSTSLSRDLTKMIP